MRSTRIRLVAAGAVSAAILGLLASPASGQPADEGGPSNADAKAAVEIHKAIESPAKVRAYWTPERMRSSKPMPTPKVPPGRRNGQPASSNVPPLTIPGSLPIGKQADTPPKTLTGADSEIWPWFAHGQQPVMSIGTLYFDLAPGDRRHCTATVVAAENESTIWTAAHCVHDGVSRWYSRFAFQPDHHDSYPPFGIWPARYMAAPTAWISGANNEYDYAALALGLNEDGAKAQPTVGAHGLKLNYGYEWNVGSFGYPSWLYQPYREVSPEDLRFCTGTTWRLSIFDQYQVMHCDMGGGSSGGPWLESIDSNGLGYLIGNVSQGNAEDMNDDVIRSPHFDSTAIHLYNEIRTK